MAKKNIARLFLLGMILAIALALPTSSKAITIFSVFGGKIQFPGVRHAPGCSGIESAISLVTLGTVNITVDQMIVGPPSNKTLGFLKINGVQTIPLPSNIYDKSRPAVPRTPQTWVLGTSINICRICNLAEDIPGVSAICDNIPGINDIVDAVCGLVGTACPIANLVWKIGSGPAPIPAVPRL